MVAASRRGAQKTLRAAAAWLTAAVFLFPLYWWASVSLRTERDIFNKPPILIPPEWTTRSYEVVLLGVSPSAASIEEGGAVHWGEGGATFALPALGDSVLIAVFSTIVTIAVSLLAAYALSRMRFAARAHFVFWILSTRMLPPAAVALPMFFLFVGWG